MLFAVPVVSSIYCILFAIKLLYIYRNILIGFCCFFLAELTLHSERVSRHCKGCTEALVNLRDQFNKLSEDVGRLIYKYREDIQGMESLYIKVNKPSM